MLNLLSPVRFALNWALRPSFRREEQRQSVAFKEFKEATRGLWSDRVSLPHPDKTVLFVSGGILQAITVELALAFALMLAGFKPVILLWRGNIWLKRYYELWGFDQFVFWDDHIKQGDHAAEISSLQSFADALNFTVDGIRVGRWVASWVMRTLRLGSFDPEDAAAWNRLLAELPQGIQIAHAAQRILQTVQPDIVVFLEKSYSPWGQLYDACLAQDIDVIQWVSAHKDNVLMLKRYNQHNQHVHPSTLSDVTWEYIQKMAWDDSKAQAVHAELFRNYESGQWYGEVGTQFNTKIQNREDIQSRLKLDPDKKTAVIFPHLFWDATFFFGVDLFADYHDWFVNAIRAAARNTHLNWVVKIHPANLVKRNRDSYAGEYSEVTAIRDTLGTLPDHIKLIEADSNISTFSLFSWIDYCLTVRGTVGIEASMFGVPTLTAGTGRYDHLGFTIDSDSKSEYMDRLAGLHNVPRLTRQQQELAQRFAYATFIMRPFPLKSVSLKYARDSKASVGSRFHVDTYRELMQAEDMRSFAEWAQDRGKEDWLQKSEQLFLKGLTVSIDYP
jgi:hypothetical protein